LTDDLTWDDNEAELPNHYTRASQGDIYHP